MEPKRRNKHGIPLYDFTGPKPTPKAAAHAKAARHICVWPQCNRDTRPDSPFWPLCLWHAWQLVKAVEDLSPHSEYHDKWQEVAAAEDQRVREDRKRREEVLKARPDQPGWIYYIQFSDQIKIGYSRDVYRRLRSLAANGVLLAVHPGTMTLEKSLHRQFAIYLAARREYFTDCPALRDHIDQVLEQFGPPPKPGEHQRAPQLRPKGWARNIA